MRGAEQRAALQENMALVYAQVPTELRAHLESLGVVPSMFLPPWLLTVFSADFPLSFTARLVDIMLAEGWQRILINTAASLLTVAKDALLEARRMEAALNILKACTSAESLGTRACTLDTWLLCFAAFAWSRPPALCLQDQMPALPVSQLHEIVSIARTLPWTAPEMVSSSSTNELQKCFSNSSAESRRRTRPVSLCLPPRAAQHGSRASLSSGGTRRSGDMCLPVHTLRSVADAPSLAELGGKLVTLQLELSRQGEDAGVCCKKDGDSATDGDKGLALHGQQDACSPMIAAHGVGEPQTERNPFVQTA